MTTTVARINTIVTANTAQFTASMAKAQKTAGTFATKAATAARAASGPLTLGLLGAGAAAVGAASDFEASMTKIESLVGLSSDAVDGMTDSVKQLSGETGRGPAELADAMFFITSAGLRGAAAMETLEASAKAAAVGLGDTATIADLATSALNAYGAENLSATNATDVLVAAVREGKLEASELAGSMGRVLPIASAMGVRFDEVGAAFAALSRTGTNAAEAATQVRGILSSLLRPTKQAEDALTGMGLSSEGLREQLREEGLLATLQTLAEEFDGNSAAAASVFGNIRALSGVMDLMGANTATTEQIFASMTDTTGALQQAFDVTSDTSAFKFRQALAQLQETLVNLGEAVMPVVLTMVEGFQSLVRFISELPTPLKIAAGAMAAFVVASGPIGQIALAVGGLMFAIGKLGEEGRRARDRQAELTAEFVAAGDPTATMIDRMTTLASSIEDVADASEDATDPVSELVGSNLALGMAMDNEVLPLFHELGLTMDDVAAAAEGGSDEFQHLERTFISLNGENEQLRDGFEDLTDAERKVAEALLDARLAGRITDAQFRDMLDVVDETADAFDDTRKEVEAMSEEFIKSADAVKLLNNANLDGEAILGRWTDAGLSYTEMARRIDIITGEMAESADGYSVEAHRAGIETGNLADELDGAEGPLEEVAEDTDDLAEAMGFSADETARMRDEFTKLMGAILGEGNALKAAEDLAADLAETVSLIGSEEAPDMADAFVQGGADIGGVLDEVISSFGAFDDPEVIAAIQAATTSLITIGEKAGRSTEEIDDLRLILAALDGTNVDFNMRVLSAAFTGYDPLGIGAELAGFAGATGGIVTRPTMALIGEAGPEAVVPLSTAPGASPLPSGFSGGGTTNVTINMPVGSNAGDIIRTLDDYSRRNGRVPISVG